MKTTKYALAKATGFLGLIIAVGLPARATTISFANISTTPSGLPAPTGSFTYIPTGPFSVTDFTNFNVTWDGITFDLTGSANGPETFGGDECGAVFSGSARGFTIMNQAVTGCQATPTYEWFASTGNPALGQGASFAFGVITNGLGDAQRGGASIEIFSDPTGTPIIPNASASGTWTLTSTAPVPEPASGPLLATGLLVLMGVRRKFRLA